MALLHSERGSHSGGVGRTKHEGLAPHGGEAEVPSKGLVRQELRSPVEDPVHFVHANLHVEASDIPVRQAVDVAQHLWQDDAAAA